MHGSTRRYAPMLAALRTLLLAVVLAVAVGETPAFAAGSWVRQKSPNPGAFGNYLYSVSPTSATDAWAAGLDLAGAGSDCGTLIEHYNGTKWTHVASPNPGTGDDFLYGIKMASSTNGWAVGSYGTSAASKTLVVHYNGSTWAQQTSASPDPAFNALTALTVRSATDAWAVGARGLGSPWYDCSVYARPGGRRSPPGARVASVRTLIEHYNGTSWTTQSSVNPGGCSNMLYGASSTSSSDVWAAGFFTADCSVGSDRTLVEHDDGSGWARMVTPSPGSSGDVLYSISADAPSDVWAVGAEFAGTGYGNGLILHYDGAHWTSFKVVGTTTPLFGVKATSATNVWAVGRDGFGPLILHFDGIKWKRQSVKAPTGSSILQGIGATGTGNAFTVGAFAPSMSYETLVYHYG